MEFVFKFVYLFSGGNGAQSFVQRHEWARAHDEAGPEVLEHDSRGELSQVSF